jgi:hypothetical protein
MMRWRCGGPAALALMAVLATAQPARAQCAWMEQFWDGIRWVCWTHPLFPDVSFTSLAPDANPYWVWAQNWGGANWRFYNWESR